MEPFIPSISKEQTINEENTLDIIYYLNRGIKYTDKMKITYIDEQFNKNLNIISYKDIKISFEQFLDKKHKNINKENDINEDSEVFDIQVNNIVYEYIRYFNGKGWVSLCQNGIILINKELNFDNLQIMIKATILSKENFYINKKFEGIGKEINKIKTDLDEIKNDDINYSKAMPFNSIILIANSLFDNEGKEFRTMNDFNIIPSTLYNLFKESEYLIFIIFIFIIL